MCSDTDAVDVNYRIIVGAADTYVSCFRFRKRRDFKLGFIGFEGIAGRAAVLRYCYIPAVKPEIFYIQYLFHNRESRRKIAHKRLVAVTHFFKLFCKLRLG